MSHRPPMANPYLKMGGAGCARQTYDQYEFVPPKKAQSSRPASAGKPKATQGDHLMAAKAARPQLTAPSAPPPATPPAPSPKYAAPASSRVPRPAQPAAASAALAAVFSAPPAPAPVPVVDPEVHELKEMFNSPARPPPARPERRIPGKTHPPVDYTTAIKAHEQMSAQRAAIRAIADGETSADKIAAANGAWMDRGNMQPARTHTRTVVSRFGEMMEESYALPVPPQPWEQQPPQLSQDSVNKHFELTGGSRSGATNTQKFDSTPSFRSRTAASKQVAAPGVPGYMGHIPHAAMGRGNHSPREVSDDPTPNAHYDPKSYPPPRAARTLSPSLVSHVTLFRTISSRRRTGRSTSRPTRRRCPPPATVATCT